ncbi:MAG TPA: ABC transporter ATP-binding protein [Polyangiaceae bacterium]|nr:ABC transporter ATP-binding protein [Polyangiaceae bacterium]
MTAAKQLDSSPSAAGVDVTDPFGVIERGRPPLLEAVDVTKRFGSQLALHRASIRLEPGTVHALLGENGAGKSTLVKCIMGFYHADSGEVRVAGVPIRLGSPRDAQAHSIGMVYQHFTLVENMTVMENLVLARTKVPAIIDWAREKAGIDAFMEAMPFAIDPNRLVRKLAAGEKQKLEILKQLYLGSRIVILDEPTSVLTPQEADEVLGLLRRMTDDGAISVLMITHKFREVIGFADVVTVLRRGVVVGGGDVSDLSPAKMAEMMVGSEPPGVSIERALGEPGSAVLEVKRLEALDDIGVPVLRGVELAVRAGEIVGIAGVSGNGQEELVEVLAGQRPAHAGDVVVSGKPYSATRREINDAKVRLLPEAPLRNACVPSMSVAENIALRVYDSERFTFAKVGIQRGELRRAALAAISTFHIRAPSPDVPIRTLSGGNVQRAVLARELHGEVALLVAANPCFGLDFAAVAEIRTRVLEARNAGTAVLLVSADLDEIFALSDRILVMSEGKIVHETPAATADRAVIGQHMAGHA